MEALEAEVATEIKEKQEENMVMASKEKQVEAKASEEWGKFTHPQRIAVILESHTFPAVLKKDWKDISPKLQTRLLSGFKAALTAKAPEAPKVAPVEANKEVKVEELKPVVVMSDEEAKAEAERRMKAASDKAAAKAAKTAAKKMVTPVEKPTKASRKTRSDKGTKVGKSAEDIQNS
jgi:hypothetical protein